MSWVSRLGKGEAGSAIVSLAADPNARIDPYLVWQRLSAFRWSRPMPPPTTAPAPTEPGPATLWLPFIMQTTAGVAELKKQLAAEGIDPSTVLVNASVYEKDLPLTGTPPLFVTAYVAEDQVQEVMKRVVRMQIGVPRIGGDVKILGEGLLEDASERLWNWPVDVPPEKQFYFGLIDDGCNFAHPAYRVGQGTRVLQLWDQSPDAPNWDGAGGSQFGYGAVLTNQRMNSYMRHEPREMEVYRAAYARVKHARRRYPSLLKARATHGSSAMQLLAGAAAPLPQSPPGQAPADAAGRAPLFFVQLPNLMLADTSSAALCVSALDALRYIIDRAETHAPGRDADGRRRERVYPKVVINLSYGGMTGPHDGTGLLDKAIEELVMQRGDLAVTVAAGNNARTECHAQVRLQREEEGDVGVIVAPLNPLTSTIEIWWPDDGQVEISVESPDGERSDWIPAGEVQELVVRGAPVAWVIHPRANALAERRRMALLAIAPTQRDRGDGRMAPHGRWVVRLKNTGGPVDMHLWAERNDMADARVRRQQCRMVALRNATLTSSGTICYPASSEGAVAVGARVWSTGKRTDYSARGSEAVGKACTDADAFVDLDSRVKGLRVSAVQSGGSVRMSGTSAAAPLVARSIANWMHEQAGPVQLDRILQELRKQSPCP